MPIIGINSAGGRKPGTPTSVSASAGNASATVTFTEPTYEGKTGVATYVATSSPGSVTGTSTTSPITVSSLTNGTAYTFTVVANTPYGVSSDTSSASGSVNPAAPNFAPDFPPNFAPSFSTVQCGPCYYNCGPPTYTDICYYYYETSASDYAANGCC